MGLRGGNADSLIPALDIMEILLWKKGSPQGTPNDFDRKKYESI